MYTNTNVCIYFKLGCYGNPYSNTNDLPYLLEGCGTVVLNDGLVWKWQWCRKIPAFLYWRWGSTLLWSHHLWVVIWFKLNTFRPYIVAVVALRMFFFFFFVTKEGKELVLFCPLCFGDERIKWIFDYHLSLPVYLISPLNEIIFLLPIFIY